MMDDKIVTEVYVDALSDISDDGDDSSSQTTGIVILNVNELSKIYADATEL
jgi:hypothetical protein